MIFVINNLKYDTDKMQLVSEKTKAFSRFEGISLAFARQIRGDNGDYGRFVDSKIYVSKKGNYLEVYEDDYHFHGRALTEEEVKEKLMKYDLETREKLFGNLEEA